MHGYIRRVIVAAAAGVALSTVGVAGASASAAASRAPQAVRVSSAGTHAAVSPGAQLWAKLYNGSPTLGHAESVAVSPDGKTVFVTGSKGEDDYVTIAYNAATGAQRWIKAYNGVVAVNFANALAVSPNGKTVFVTGQGDSASFVEQYATVAYNAATGAQLWVKRHSGVLLSADGYYNSVAVSPTGGAVYVTGINGDASSAGAGYDTIAYNAATGAQLWAKRYSSSGGALSLAVSPDGSTVFATGETFRPGAGIGYATVAYNAATGAQLWAKSYVGNLGAIPRALAYSVAVSPSGGTVYVTGLSWKAGFDYATIAYNAATGAQQWIKLYAFPGNNSTEGLGPVAEAVSPTTGTVIVTGADVAGEWATVAYSG